jgi:hypothetical protein
VINDLPYLIEEEFIVLIQGTVNIPDCDSDDIRHKGTGYSIQFLIDILGKAEIQDFNRVSTVDEMPGYILEADWRNRRGMEPVRIDQQDLHGS